MAWNKETISKVSTYFGYSVYVISVVFGAFLIFGDPTVMTSTNPSYVQIGGLLIICYGLVECAVTYYNRIPPMPEKTQEQIAINKAKLRERNDAKSKERKTGKQE